MVDDGLTDVTPEWLEIFSRVRNLHEGDAPSLNHTSLLAGLEDLEKGGADDQEEEQTEVDGTNRHLLFLTLPERLGHLKTVHFAMQVFVELAIANLKPAVHTWLLGASLGLMHVHIVVLMCFLLISGLTIATDFALYTFPF